jgi:hypothetical protein
MMCLGMRCESLLGRVVVMRLSYVSRCAGTLALTGSILTCCVATAVPAQAVTAAAATGICKALPVNGQPPDAALATKLSRGIRRALSSRVDAYGLEVNDPHLGILCTLHSTERFLSASVVKATILAALLHKAKADHRGLTGSETHLARLMITQSDNNAATALWNDVGRSWLQRFLGLARMSETVLGPGGYWGLTQITSRDESRLLWLLMTPGTVLTRNDRAYELTLMSQVIPAQRWGVPAGAPAGFTVHVKNGWAPLPTGDDPWYVNSIGCFTRGAGAKDYSIVVLTRQTPSHPSMAYGVTTMEDVALVIHRDLNAGTLAAVPRSTPNPSWTVPDEPVPPAG